MPLFHYRLQALLDQKLEQKQEAERLQVQRRRELRASEQFLAGLQVRQGELEAARTVAARRCFAAKAPAKRSDGGATMSPWRRGGSRT